MPIPQPLDVVRQLVAQPSVSSPDPRFDQPNADVIDRLAEWCEHLGFRVEVSPLPTDEAKRNLVATLGDGPEGLVLSGHTDTVPFDEARWDTDPFDLVEKDDQLFGLGSADMKGFFAAALHAASQFDAGKLRNPVILVATADEESTMNGARALVEAKRPTAKHCIIGEPTGLVPVRTHKGILMEAIHLAGRSGHSSNPALGVSALDAMHEAMGALIEVREALAAEHQDNAFAVPAPTINLGRIEGGDSPNRICASCSLTFDVRLLPSMELEATRERIQAAVRARLRDSKAALEFESLVAGVPSFGTPADAEIVRVAESLSDTSAQAVMFCTEGPFFNAMGMETIIWGAGSIDVAHQPNEYTSRSQLTRATELYAQAIHQFCVET